LSRRKKYEIKSKEGRFVVYISGRKKTDFYSKKTANDFVEFMKKLEKI